jgi:hypothetical protein
MTIADFALVLSIASLLTSFAGLFVTNASYHKIDDGATEAFLELGGDLGNHEARLERLETKAGLQIVPSPSSIAVANDDAYFESFADEHENTELQGSEEVESGD